MSESSAPPRLSMTAAASLVCGLLGWLVLPAFIAVVTGIIGLRLTRKPNVRGRGMAMGGLILGLIFGAVGVGLAITAYQAYYWGVDQINARLPQVVNAAIDSAPYDAKTYDTMSAESVASTKTQTAGWGHLTAVQSIRMTGDRLTGHPDQMRLSGEATFDQAGNKAFEVIIEAKDNEVRIAEVTFK